MSVTIIAEAGLNWKNYEDARQLAFEAKNCGADIIKYQTHFNWKYPMLSKEKWKQLKKFCDDAGIIFMSTAWSFEAIDFLAEIGMTHWKIPSSEVTNQEYIYKICAKHPKKIFVSTGFEKIYYSNGLDIRINDINTKKGKSELFSLYCISKYPTNINELKFKGCDDSIFDFDYDGYSDHTDDIYAPIIAVTHGAQVIEKHFCLSHPCIDDAVSITPDKFKEMVDVIRQLENYKEPIIPPEILALKNRVKE